MGDAAALRVFISYRREDTAGYAGRLYDSLSSRLADADVFMDVGGIELGVDFTAAISDAVGSCDVMLALIGTRWVTAATPAGIRRLDDTDDYVVTEISAALERQIRVIPVLIEGARMPEAADLPNRIRDLARRNALNLDTAGWSTDLEVLAAALRRVVPQTSGSERPVLSEGQPGSGRAAGAVSSRHEPPATLLRQRWAPRSKRGTAAVLAVAVVPVIVAVALGASTLRSGGSSKGGGTCYDTYFKGIPPDRITDLEEGAIDVKFLRPDLPLDQPVGLRFTSAGQGIGALRVQFFSSGELFKLQSVIDARCRRVEDYGNESRPERAKGTFGQYENLRARLGSDFYLLSIQVVDSAFFKLRFARAK